MKKILIIAAVIIAIAAGVYFFKNKNGGIGGLGTNVSFGENNVLSYVPADTLLFTGSPEPISFEKAMAMSQRMGFDPSSYMFMDNHKLELDDAPDGARFLLGFYGHYMNAFGTNSLSKTLGVNDQLNAAIYTVGAIPVIRVELDGTETFNQLVSSIETEQKITPVVKSLDAVEYREYSFDDKGQAVPYKLVVSIHENQAVISVDTPIADDSDLKPALGITKPAQSILDSGRLNALSSKYGYLGHNLFFMDIDDLVKGLTNPQANSFGKMVNELMIHHGNADALAEIQTPACQTEIDALAANWPEINAGYTKFADDHAEMKMVLEGSNTELMDTLSRLRGHLSENLNSQEFAFSMGLGINMDELVPVITDVWKRLTKDPYQCPSLASMQEGLKQQNPMMLGMMTGMLSGIKGIGFGITDMNIEGLQQAQGNPAAVTENMEMMVTLTAEEPTNFLQTLGMYAPELAQLNLVDGGEALPLAAPMGGTNAGKIALRGKDLVFMVGKNADATASSLKSTSSTESNGFMSFKMDFGKYMELISAVVNEVDADPNASEEQVKIIEQQKAMFEQMKKINGDIQSTVDFGKTGISSTTSFETK